MLLIGTILFLEILTSFTLFSTLFPLPINPVAELTSSFRDSSDHFATAQPGRPQIFDINLKAEIVFQGLDFPSSFVFMGPDDILVLGKNNGTVQRIVNGTLEPKPLLDVNVANRNERGMLGIDIAKHDDMNGRTTNVFLYFTESKTKDGSDVDDNIQPLGNRVYRYELVGDKLINPKLLLDLPAEPGYAHNGGRIVIGPDNNVYFTIGDMNFPQRERFFTRAENVENGEEADGRAGILRVTPDGQPLQNDSLIGDKYPLNVYYAYGLRNSFGIDFDPLTGNLWDTENGDRHDDEINLVKPGFNSGWNKVQGVWENDRGPDGPIMSEREESNTLVDFNGQGIYSDPEFTWADVVGPTALKFFDSKIYGKEYENDMFVGDFHNGNIYHFDLTENRTALELDGILKDKVANNQDELTSTVFGRGFGGITDIAVGPDGYLYILSVYQGGSDCISREQNASTQVQTGEPSCIFYSSQLPGTIFRVIPVTATSSSEGIDK